MPRDVYEEESMKSKIALTAVVTCLLHIAVSAESQSRATPADAGENAPPPKAVRVVVEPLPEAPTGSLSQPMRHVRVEQRPRAGRRTAHTVKPAAPTPTTGPPSGPPLRP
jgi:hypothetical protein